MMWRTLSGAIVMGSERTPGLETHCKIALRSYEWPEGTHAGTVITSYVIGHLNDAGAVARKSGSAGSSNAAGQ
jgi:hypothetical protein